MAGGREEKTRHTVKKLRQWWRDHLRWWLLLVVMSILLWQFRFQRAGANLLPHDVCHSLAYWSGGKVNGSDLVKADENGLFLSKLANTPNVSLTRELLGIDDVRYVAVTCRASWENAVPHAVTKWLQPRIVIIGYDQNHRFCAPLDHAVLAARGTRDWHRVQTVMELPPALHRAVLSVDASGQSGTLRVRDLTLEVVEQRAWFLYASALLMAGWGYVIQKLLRHHISGAWARLRAWLAAVGVILAFWFFVFPQGRTVFPSLLPAFFMGPEIVASDLPVVTDEKPVASQPSIDTTHGNEPKPMVVSESPVPQVRKYPALSSWLRELDRKMNWHKYNLTHLLAFFAIGLAVFGVAGSLRVWRLPLLVAVLSEIVPNALYQTWDSEDLWDLAANILGLALAMACVVVGRKCWSDLRKKPAAETPAD